MRTKADQAIFDLALKNTQQANQAELFGGGKIASDAFLAKLTSGTVDAAMLAEAKQVYDLATSTFMNHMRSPELRGDWGPRELHNANKLASNVYYAIEALLQAQNGGGSTDD